MYEPNVKVLLNPSPLERQDLTDGIVLYNPTRSLSRAMFHFSAVGVLYSKPSWKIEVVMNVPYYFFSIKDLYPHRVPEEDFFKQLKEHRRGHLDWLLFHPEVLCGEYLP